MSSSTAVTGSNESPKDWLSWFDSHQSAVKINKSKQEKIFSSFDALVPEADCIDLIMNHNETVFLHKLNFGSKQVNIFHHLV